MLRMSVCRAHSRTTNASINCDSTTDHSVLLERFAIAQSAVKPRLGLNTRNAATEMYTEPFWVIQPAPRSSPLSQDGARLGAMLFMNGLCGPWIYLTIRKTALLPMCQYSRLDPAKCRFDRIPNLHSFLVELETRPNPPSERQYFRVRVFF